MTLAGTPSTLVPAYFCEGPLIKQSMQPNSAYVVLEYTKPNQWNKIIGSAILELAAFLGAEPHTPLDEAVRRTLIRVGCLSA